MGNPKRFSPLFAIAVWILFAGAYLLFAGQVSTTEAIAGVAATTMAAAFAILLRRAQSRALQLNAPWLRVIGRPLASLYPDAIRVGGMLLQAIWRRPDGPMGTISRQSFHHGADHAAADAGRRAMVGLAISFAPNGYMLSMPDGQDVLVMHRLAPAPPSPDQEWPT